MSNIKKDFTNEPQVPTDLRNITPVEVKGLTIREIRYQRALLALQKEFCREKINSGVLRLKNSSPFSKGYEGKSKHFGRAAGIMGKFMGGLNYLDYIVLGFSLFSNVKKAMRFFKKK